MIKINSLSDFRSRLKDKERAYLLLYNSSSEKGICAIKSISDAQEEVDGLKVFFADVSIVRDIHTVYNITSEPSLLEFEGNNLKNVIKGCNSERHYKAIFNEALYKSKINKEGKPAKSLPFLCL